MATVHHVKSARKDNPAQGIKKGESYYWWAFRSPGARSGFKVYSKTPPKRWQLTQSEFFSTLWQIEDDVLGGPLDPKDGEAVKSVIEDAVSQLQELADETRSRFENMPEGLQQGDTGQMLEGRAEACDNAVSELEQIDTDCEGRDKDDYPTEEEFWESVVEQIQAVSVDAP